MANKAVIVTLTKKINKLLPMMSWQCEDKVYKNFKYATEVDFNSDEFFTHLGRW